MNNNKKIILSFNMNAWCPICKDITFDEKISKVAEYLKNKYDNMTEVAVICLQEFIPGTDCKYVNKLKEAFPAYSLLLPPNFDYFEHTKSLLTITLVRKEYKKEILRFESCLPNRICYFKVWLDDTPVPVRIMNIYAVQTVAFSPGAAASYIAGRKQAKEELWSRILSEAKSCTEPLVICGDFQEGSTGPNIKKLFDMGFREKVSLPTVRNDFFGPEQNIDHFLYNAAAWEKWYPVKMDYDGNLLDEISDHVLLAAVSA